MEEGEGVRKRENSRAVCGCVFPGRVGGSKRKVGREE